MIDPNRWVNTLPAANRNNPIKKYSLITVMFVIGLIFVSLIKNETRNLQKEINILQTSINTLKLDLHRATLDHEVISSPENISRLAEEYLESEFIYYKRSQINHLNGKKDTLARSEVKKQKIALRKESKKNNEKIKLKVAKKIEKTKTELRKLQELYHSPGKLSDKIRFQVAKKIKSKKEELNQLYSDPYSLIKSKNTQKWAGLQIVKAFLGIPIVPGR